MVIGYTILNVGREGFITTSPIVFAIDKYNFSCMGLILYIYFYILIYFYALLIVQFLVVD